VDIVLTLGSLVIACEISATTTAEHEFEKNIKKCLQAGFARIFHVCDATRRRQAIMERIEAGCTPEERSRIHCLTTRQFLTRLAELAQKQRAESTQAEASAGKTVLDQGAALTPEERKQALDDAWARIGRNKKRDRTPPNDGSK